MVRSDAYCRRLPRILSPRQRLQIDALVFASDIAAVALDRFNVAAATYGAAGASAIARSETAKLFSESWTIVDQIHIARRLLKKHAGTKDNKGAFLKEFEWASLMRNKMDHIDANLANLAARTGRADPLFGVVSFSRPREPEGSPPQADGLYPITAFTIMIGESPTEHPAVLLEFSTCLQWPIAQPTLAAFGMRIRLDLAVARLCELVEAISDEVEHELSIALASLKVSEKDRAYWSEPAGGDMIMEMDMLVPKGSPPPS